MPRRRLFDLSTLTADQLTTMSKASNKTRTGHYPWLGQPLVNYRSSMSRMPPSDGSRVTIIEPATQAPTRAPPSVGATSAPSAPGTKNKVLATSIPMVTYVNDSRFSKRTYKKSATNRKNIVKKPLGKRSVTKTLQKEVKDLKQAINSINSHHTYKGVTAGSLKSLIGRCNQYSWQGATLSTLETATANLRFFDPAAPATLVTANPNTGTYARDISIKNFYGKFLMRNNYQVPVKVKLYLCKVKNDSSSSVLTTYTNAITDQVINAGVDETDALVYLTDIERVKENWSVDCVVDKVLEPGHEASASHSTGPFAFDPSHLDLNTDNYQKGFKSFEWFLRVEGVLGHDTAAGEYSLLLAGVDVQLFQKVDIVYNSGGADLDDIYIAEGRVQAFTNGGVASLKPVADNLAYSVS